MGERPARRARRERRGPGGCTERRSKAPLRGRSDSECDAEALPRGVCVPTILAEEHAFEPVFTCPFARLHWPTCLARWISAYSSQVMCARFEPPAEETNAMPQSQNSFFGSLEWLVMRLRSPSAWPMYSVRRRSSSAAYPTRMYTPPRRGCHARSPACSTRVADQSDVGTNSETACFAIGSRPRPRAPWTRQG